MVAMHQFNERRIPFETEIVDHAGLNDFEKNEIGKFCKALADSNWRPSMGTRFADGNEMMDGQGNGFFWNKPGSNKVPFYLETKYILKSGKSVLLKLEFPADEKKYLFTITESPKLTKES